jgi:hypothetical protein
MGGYTVKREKIIRINFNILLSLMFYFAPKPGEMPPAPATCTQANTHFQHHYFIAKIYILEKGLQGEIRLYLSWNQSLFH